jgi:hypothetical protein
MAVKSPADRHSLKFLALARRFFILQTSLKYHHGRSSDPAIRVVVNVESLHPHVTEPIARISRPALPQIVVANIHLFAR